MTTASDAFDSLISQLIPPILEGMEMHEEIIVKFTELRIMYVIRKIASEIVEGGYWDVEASRYTLDARRVFYMNLGHLVCPFAKSSIWQTNANLDSLYEPFEVCLTKYIRENVNI